MASITIGSVLLFKRVNLATQYVPPGIKHTLDCCVNFALKLGVASLQVKERNAHVLAPCFVTARKSE